MRRFLKVVKYALSIAVAIALVKLVLVYFPAFDPLHAASGWTKKLGDFGFHFFVRDEKDKPETKVPESSLPEADRNRKEKPEAAENLPAEKKPDDSGDTGKKEDPEGYFLTASEVMAVQNASIPDRIAALAVAGKLKQADIGRIYGLVRDGVTNGEKSEIEEILRAGLSNEDVAKLVGLLEKYKK